MKATIRRVIQDPQISVDDIDISNDPVLVDRYGLEIPVLAIDGKKVAKYRVSEEELKRMVQSREEGW
jgi:Glutaredoxin-like domain (DUF836)